MCKNIGQSGRPVVLCGSAIPAQFESCPERRYFAALHYLALICEEPELVRRLQARPGWRNAGSSEFVERMIGFNRWFIEHTATSDPPITLLDTTHLTLTESATAVAAWVRQRT